MGGNHILLKRKERRRGGKCLAESGAWCLIEVEDALVPKIHVWILGRGD